MKIIDQSSLFITLDNLNDFFFRNEKISVSERKQISKWIIERHGLKGSYANMFAPTEKDYKGIKLFTGDKITSHASIGHILGEETLRALYILDIKDPEIKNTISKAKKGILEAISKANDINSGVFCCGKCSVSLWRNLASESVRKNKVILDNGIRHLKSYRDGNGKWKRFPFFYTLLTLLDIDLPSAKRELSYASERCRKYFERKSKDDLYSKRKKEISRRVLERTDQVN